MLRNLSFHWRRMVMKKIVYVCPYCGSEVEVSDGNCWHCPNCGMGECGISEDMVVELDMSNLKLHV